MIANYDRVNASTDVDELVGFLIHARQSARTFAEIGERFRLAPSRSRTPSILKHDVNTVFAVQAGELLRKCLLRGMFFIYRPQFYLPLEEEPRLRCVFAWFTFIRSHLAPAFRNRFRADWQSEFAPEMDHIIGQKDRPQPDFGPAVSDDPKELVLWRLELFADVHATACVILSEELEQLGNAIEQRLKKFKSNSKANAGSGGAQPKYTEKQLDSFHKWWDEYSEHCGSKRKTCQGFLEWGESQELVDFPCDLDEVNSLQRALRYRKDKTRRQNNIKR